MCVCAHTCLCRACLHRSEHTLSYLSPSSTLCEAGSLGCWLHMPGPLAPPSSAGLQMCAAAPTFEVSSGDLNSRSHTCATSTLPTEPSWPPSSLRCSFLCCYYLYFLRPPWESSPWVWYSGQSTWKEHLVPKKAKEIMLSWLVSMTGQM